MVKKMENKQDAWVKILAKYRNSKKSQSKKQMVKKIKNKQDQWICSRCGYTSSGKFIGDICPQCGLTYWKCVKCDFTITTATPPEVCPGCKGRWGFVNVTCYTPDCGGPGNIDPRIYPKRKY